MNNLPSWVTKVTSTWVAIGAFLVVLGTQGINLPDVLADIFSQTFVDAFLQVIGAVLTFVQFVRVIFAKKGEEGAVQILSKNDKIKFALNPFKLI